MTTPLTDVKGIGGATAAKLAETGLDSAEALAAAAIEEIAACPGFGPARATTVRQAAIALLEPQGPAAGEAGSKKSEEKAGKPARKEKKVKKAKKAKKEKKAKKKADAKKKSSKKGKGKAKKKGKKGKKK